MTKQEAKDFDKWLPCELDYYLDDNNLGSLTKIPLSVAIEEARHIKGVAQRWIDEGDTNEYEIACNRLHGAKMFLRKYSNTN